MKINKRVIPKHSKICKEVFYIIDELPRKYRYYVVLFLHNLQIYRGLKNLDRKKDPYFNKLKELRNNKKRITDIIKRCIKAIKKKERNPEKDINGNTINNKLVWSWIREDYISYLEIKINNLLYLDMNKIGKFYKLINLSDNTSEYLGTKNIYSDNTNLNIIRYVLIKGLHFFITQGRDLSIDGQIHLKFAMLKQIYSMYEKANKISKDSYERNKKKRIHNKKRNLKKYLNKNKQSIEYINRKITIDDSNKELQIEIENIMKTKSKEYRIILNRFISKYKEQIKNNYLGIYGRTKYEKKEMYQVEYKAYNKDLSREINKVKDLPIQELKTLIDKL